MRNRLETLAVRLENQQPAVILFALFAAYAIALIFPLQRRLWHDELFTYYISQAPDWSTVMWESQYLDLNPPLMYALIRGWHRVFGTGETVSRVVPALAFLGASFGFAAFLRKRVGWLWASACVLLFWASPNFLYATELRPYALLLLFYALTLLSWDAAKSPDTRRVALPLLALFASAMMLCHVLAIFPLGTVYLGEIFRSVRRRKADWPLYICLLLPLAIVPTYFSSTQSGRVATSAYPALYQGGVRKLVIYFGKTLLGIAVPLLGAALVAFGAARAVARNLAGRLKSLSPADFGLGAGLFLIPVIINAMLYLTHGAFFERYCLVTALGISVTAVLLLGWVTGWSRAAALCALVVLAGFVLQGNFLRPLLWRPSPSFVSDQIHTNLPVVAASGLTFLEMDHYEKPELLARLYFLTDPASSLRYAHASIFDGMATEAEYFPFRSTVMPYQEFVQAHRKFLVVGTVNFAEDWLLRKLIAEGAGVNKVSKLLNLSYKDSDVYEITITN